MVGKRSSLGFVFVCSFYYEQLDIQRYLCPMYGVLVLCMGYLSYVWGISLVWGICLMCWKKSHVTRVQLWRSVSSYVWDIRLMYGILVLCVGYYFYVWDFSLMCGIFVLCVGYSSYVWDISLMCWVLVLCLGY